MSYLVLARKWRPRLFDEVVGQRHVTKTLENAIISSRVAHAFLFTGTRGVGKTSVARILAKALNCQEGPTPQPCNQCRSCMDIAAGISMDVLEIDGASNTGVDDVRELRENVRYLPSKGRYRIYIIDEVHMLSNSAFNALLKTLEEPPRHIIFMFATTEPHKIPKTILSRCQRYDLKKIPVKDIQTQLKLVVADEKIRISDSSLSMIARKAEGSLRDAQSILDQAISFGGENIDDNEIAEILGVIDRKLLYETSLSIIQKEPQKCLDIIENVHNYGHDIREFYGDLLEHFRNLIVAKVTQNPSKLIDLPENEIEELMAQGTLVAIDEIQLLFRILSMSEEEIIKSTHPKLMMEMTLVRMAHLRPLLSIDDILAKMNHLEGRLKDLTGDDGFSEERNPHGIVHQSPVSSVSKDFEREEPTGIDHDTPLQGECKIENLDAKEIWIKLIDFVRKRRPLLASMLEIGELLHLEDGKIDLGFEENSVFLDSVNESQNKEELQGICREFFKKDINICIKPVAPSADTLSMKEKERERKDRAGELRREALDNPIVKDAIHIFGGEVTEIKI
ncbi:MAG: DNA polymerase III subunit gamma/tau [Thermodesulfobacteriota bacterium]|nr:DNA polymerase III subunit gamma/tau [Thermodesulfobacteriota bacterium]